MRGGSKDPPLQCGQAIFSGTEELDAGATTENHRAGGDCVAPARGATYPERPGAREWRGGDGAGHESGRGEGSHRSGGANDYSGRAARLFGDAQAAGSCLRDGRPGGTAHAKESTARISRAGISGWELGIRGVRACVFDERRGSRGRDAETLGKPGGIVLPEGEGAAHTRRTGCAGKRSRSAAEHGAATRGDARAFREFLVRGAHSQLAEGAAARRALQVQSSRGEVEASWAWTAYAGRDSAGSLSCAGRE